MLKNITIVILATATVLALLLALHNARPICHDLFREKVNGDLICSYNLGPIAEDDADVLIRK